MLRMLGASVLAATVVFIWGFVFWAVLPIGNSAVQGPADAAALQQILDSQLSQSGMYMVPYSETPETDTAYHQAHTRGPLAMIQFRKTGAEPMSTGAMVQGWLHGLLSFLVMAIAVRLATPAGGFGARFMVAFGGGFAGSVFATFANPIWWYQPWSFAGTQFFYQAVAWLLGGVALAMVLRPSGPRPDPSML